MAMNPMESSMVQDSPAAATADDTNSNSDTGGSDAAGGGDGGGSGQFDSADFGGDFGEF
jgi:hypothetical protein